MQAYRIEDMVENYHKLIAKISILKFAETIYTTKDRKLSEMEGKPGQIKKPLMDDFHDINLKSYGGVIPISDQLTLRKLVFRATRGKAFL